MGLSESLRAYFCNPSALCATAGFVAIVFVNNAYLFWAPKFAAEKFAVDVGAAGKGVMLWHHLFAFGAILVGGVLTDRFVSKMPRFRLGFQILALFCGAPMLLWIGFSQSFAALLVAASAYGVFRGFFEVNTHASLFDVVSPQFRSTAVGLLNMIAFFFGGLSGVAMGALSQKWGVRGFEVGFGIMAAFYAVAALLMMFSFFFTFKKNRVVDCLLQFHIASEDTKFGLSMDEAEELLQSEEYKAMANVRIVGVMGMATFTSDVQQVRSEFASLKGIFTSLKEKYFSEMPAFAEISMGMSDDYPIALEEGSTLVRVGSAIFGARNYNI
jgi:MFS family permease